MNLKKDEREEVMKSVRAAMEEIYKTPKYYEANDVILSPAQVTEQFPFLSKDWVKRYGWFIPRVRVDKWDDETCKSKFGYSRNQIIEWINMGVFRRVDPFIRIDDEK